MAPLAFSCKARYLLYMVRRVGARVERNFREGRRQLARHRPDRALDLFRSAVDDCPASASGRLAERLYWLAVALLQLDRAELALRSLASAQKLRPRGRARRAYELRVNQYGMIRRANPDLDDFYAFYSIHACRFLSSRPGQRFASSWEKDTVTRIIAEAWLGLKRSGRLAGLAAGGRLTLFKAWPVSLPAFMGAGEGYSGLGTPRPGACAEPITVDFRRGRVVGPNDRCPCGSGLPFCQCCGRTRGLREL